MHEALALAGLTCWPRPTLAADYDNIEKSPLVELHLKVPAAAMDIGPVKDRIFALYKADADQAKSDAKDDKDANPDFHSYQIDTTWRVTYESAAVLSLSADIFADTGGAHPNGGFETLVWDKRGGRGVPIEALFAPDQFRAAALAAVADAATKAWINIYTKRAGEPPGPDNDSASQEGHRPRPGRSKDLRPDLRQGPDRLANDIVPALRRRSGLAARAGRFPAVGAGVGVLQIPGAGMENRVPPRLEPQQATQGLMPTLFDPFKIGPLACPNRIWMAPLTRGRGTREHVPTELMATYYAQRASAGLILTEATNGISCGRQRLALCGRALGRCRLPSRGLAPRRLTWAVHPGRAGRIFAQLWHMGRLVHPSLHGVQPVSASATTGPGKAHTYEGRHPYVQARALEAGEISRLIDDYVLAARNAMEAGFDGVQLHAANGYLIDQFLRDGSNHRGDAYGGPVENRIRLLREVVEALELA